MLEIRDPNGKVVSIRDYNQEIIEEYNRQGTGFYARRRTNRLVVVLSTLCVLLSSVLVGILIERGGQAETEMRPAPSNSNEVNLKEFFSNIEIPQPRIGFDTDLTKEPQQRVSK